jgi:hypothetical protein
MKTPIQELIEKYNEHLKYDSDLDSISGREILKVILVDLISYQVKEKECIINAHGIQMKGVNNHKCITGEQYYKETFKQD